MESAAAQTPEVRAVFSKRGHVGIITMQDPVHSNALSSQQVIAMLTALDESRRQQARAVVIVSGVKHFCAGADIAEMLKGEALNPEVESAPHSPIQLFRALVQDPRPIIAAVDGLAMGGGVELLLCADLVLATEQARFAMPEIGLGVLPRTALVRLPEIVGRRKALELILTRRRFAAAEAYDIGLVNQLVPGATLLDEAVAMAELICGAPPGAIAAVKRTLGRVAPSDWDGLHSLLGELEPAEWQEGFSAFLAKRSPDYERLWNDQ